jgi:NitT/TauT family transport system ATP-binding protein
MSKNVLEVQNLYKAFNGKIVIENLSFKVQENEIVMLIGPSGCGKSTLLDLIAKINHYSQGKIILQGAIGYMLQKDALLSYRNIEKNLYLYLEITKKKNKENQQYVLNLATKYGLGPYLKYFPDELSGGMKQKVALIRTLSLKPDLLLLDESFASLDAYQKEKIQEDLYQIIKKEQKSALIVTHDLMEALLMSDKMIILDKEPCRIKKVIPNPLAAIDITQRRNNPLFFRYYQEIAPLINEQPLLTNEKS